MTKKGRKFGLKMGKRSSGIWHTGKCYFTKKALIATINPILYPCFLLNPITNKSFLEHSMYCQKSHKLYKYNNLTRRYINDICLTSCHLPPGGPEYQQQL